MNCSIYELIRKPDCLTITFTDYAIVDEIPISQIVSHTNTYVKLFTYKFYCQIIINKTVKIQDAILKADFVEKAKKNCNLS